MLLENGNHITQLNQDNSLCSKFVVVLFVRVTGDIHNSVGRRTLQSPSPPTLSQDKRQVPDVRSDDFEIVYVLPFFPCALLQ